MSHNPVHGNTGHEDHKVIASLTSEAVNQLQSEFPITRLYAESAAYNSSAGPYVAKHVNATGNVQCRYGSARLTVSNKNLTNFEVFNHGYNNIYPSQLFWRGPNMKSAPWYSFCYKS